MRRYQLTVWLGWFLVILSALLLMAPAVITLPLHLSLSGLVSLALMQAVIGAAIIYASRQKQLDSEIGHKVYPATLVALLLWLFMVLRWWGG